MRVYLLLKNDFGGVHWEGLPLICGWLGVRDLEALMPRLALMKLRSTAKEE